MAHLGETGFDLYNFANEGNKAIFDDVFPKLRENMNGSPKVGLTAVNWDRRILYNEQYNVVEPIYQKWIGHNANLKPILQNMASGSFPASVLQMPIKFSGDITNPLHRYQHGLNVVVPFAKKMKQMSKQ